MTILTSVFNLGLGLVLGMIIVEQEYRMIGTPFQHQYSRNFSFHVEGTQNNYFDSFGNTPLRVESIDGSQGVSQRY